MLQVLPAQSCHWSIACAVGLGSGVSLLSAGKAATGGVAIGLQDYALHDIDVDFQTPYHGLFATWQATGHMQSVWSSSSFGSTQAPGHMHSTSLAVWHAPDCSMTGPYVLSGISTYVLHASMLYVAQLSLRICLYLCTSFRLADGGGVQSRTLQFLPAPGCDACVFYAADSLSNTLANTLTVTSHTVLLLCDFYLDPTTVGLSDDASTTALAVYSKHSRKPLIGQSTQFSCWCYFTDRVSQLARHSFIAYHHIRHPQLCLVCTSLARHKAVVVRHHNSSL